MLYLALNNMRFWSFRFYGINVRLQQLFNLKDSPCNVLHNVFAEENR